MDGTKNAKHALVISQDPESVNYIPIKKSTGKDGIEFNARRAKGEFNKKTK